MNGAGRPILESLHVSQKILKLPASDVALTPDTNTAITLSDVNAAIRGEEVSAPESDDSGVLSDSKIAEGLRSQAAIMQKEAKRLLAEAEELSPTKKAKAKKTTKKKASKARASA